MSLSEVFTFEQVQNFLDTIDLDIAMLCCILNISGFDLYEIFKEERFNRKMCSKIFAKKRYRRAKSIKKGATIVAPL